MWRLTGKFWSEGFLRYRNRSGPNTPIETPCHISFFDEKRSIRWKIQLLHVSRNNNIKYIYIIQYIYLNLVVVLDVLEVEIIFLRDTVIDSICCVFDCSRSIGTHNYSIPKPFRYHVFDRPVCRTTRRWPYSSGVTITSPSVLRAWFTCSVTRA